MRITSSPSFKRAYYLSNRISQLKRLLNWKLSRIGYLESTEKTLGSTNRCHDLSIGIDLSIQTRRVNPNVSNQRNNYNVLIYIIALVNLKKICIRTETKSCKEAYDP